jgi:Transmembrane family 220, helix
MKPVPRWFIAVCWVMAVNFSVWTGLQANDPDPIRWMLIYGTAAITTAALPARLIGAAVAGLVGAIALVWGSYLTHEVWGVIQLSDLWSKMSEKGGAVEVGREAGGLMIAAVWLLFGSAFRFLRS